MIRRLIFTMVPGLFPGETGLLKRRAQVEAEPPILRRGSWIPLNVIRPVCFIGFCCAMPVHLPAQQPWTNTTLSASQRATLLVGAMSFNEKVAMVNGAGGSYVGNIPANTRLGIPALNLNDGPAGVRLSDSSTTAFPAPITLAATWDTALARQYGSQMGAQTRGKGIEVLLGPMMNMARAYQAGRNFEGYGEEPELAGAMAAADDQWHPEPGGHRHRQALRVQRPGDSTDVDQFGRGRAHPAGDLLPAVSGLGPGRGRRGDGFLQSGQ